MDRRCAESVPVLCEVQIIPQGVSGIINESYSWAILKKAKLKNHARAQRLRTVIPEQHRAMIQPLIDRGMTMRQMAEESGMSLSTVHRWVTRIKIQAMQAA